MVTPDTIADFLSCGTGLHYGNFWLTVLFYLWVGTYEETIKFGIAKTLRGYVRNPLLVSALGYSLWEFLLRIFVYGWKFSAGMLVVPLMVHVALTRGIGRWKWAVIAHAGYDLLVESTEYGMPKWTLVPAIGIAAYYFVISFTENENDQLAEPALHWNRAPVMGRD